MSQHSGNNTPEKLEDAVKKYKVKIVKARPDVLQLDLDDPAVDLPRYLRIKEVLEQMYTILSVTETVSKSGKGRHIYIKLDTELPRVIRIMLQACLGSDPMREILAFKSHKNGCTQPILLFETEKGYKAAKQYEPEPKKSTKAA